MNTTYPRAGAVLLLLPLLAGAAVGCKRSEAKAAAAGGGGGGDVVEVTRDPNVLLTDRPTSSLSLANRRLGDPSEATGHPFGQFVLPPHRYGVTNGRITSLVCGGDVLAGMDVEPTVAGLQMRLGKADWVDEERNGEVVLYWFARKRSAAVTDGGVRWFAVYK